MKCIKLEDSNAFSIKLNSYLSKILKMYTFLDKKKKLKFKGECMIKWTILVEIALPISPYKILKNDSNGHGYYFNIWIIYVQLPTNLPKSIWKLVFNVVDVIF